MCWSALKSKPGYSLFQLWVAGEIKGPMTGLKQYYGTPEQEHCQSCVALAGRISTLGRDTMSIITNWASDGGLTTFPPRCLSLPTQEALPASPRSAWCHPFGGTHLPRQPLKHHSSSHLCALALLPAPSAHIDKPACASQTLRGLCLHLE